MCLQRFVVFDSDPPVMNSTTVKLAVDVNHPVQLICSAQSFPPPTFRWTGGGSSVGSGRVSTWVDLQLPYPFVSVLNVSSVQQSDLGMYTCTAQNEMGSSQTLFNLTVKSRSKVNLSVYGFGQRVLQVGRHSLVAVLSSRMLTSSFIRSQKSVRITIGDLRCE